MSRIAIIGAGPAGMFAAEHLSGAGHAVTVFEKMPTPGRKFLMAGRGGLNLTHSEPLPAFRARYDEAAAWLWPMIEDFPPDDLRAWSEALGQETFIGSSGRVFPRAMKASPLLRAWRSRLAERGVDLRMRHAWTGWKRDALTFDTPDEMISFDADATLLALGGASWPRLGSDGGWAQALSERGVGITSFSASNCGVEIDWSDIFRDRFAGEPLKTVCLSVGSQSLRSEAMITGYGLEGGGIYALSAEIRRALANGPARLLIDLRPDQTAEVLANRLAASRRGESLSNRLRKAAGLSPVAAGLLRESGERLPVEPGELARLIKALPLQINAQRGLDRAISSAGGIRRDAVDGNLMLKALPGVFAAGEMLDWDAPTGGYLLQASFATGLAAAKGVETWLADRG